MQWLIFISLLLLYGGQFFCLTLVWLYRNRVPPLNQQNSGVGIFGHHYVPADYNSWRHKRRPEDDKVNWKEEGF